MPVPARVCTFAVTGTALRADRVSVTVAEPGPSPSSTLVPTIDTWGSGLGPPAPTALVWNATSDRNAPPALLGAVSTICRMSRTFTPVICATGQRTVRSQVFGSRLVGMPGNVASASLRLETATD